MKFVSPNDMLSEARKHMLEGKEPETRKDWILVMNFAVCNIHHGVLPTAAYLFARIFDMPITESEIDEIITFHKDKGNISK